MKTLCLVAHDMAPSLCFEKIKSEMGDDCKIISFLCYGGRVAVSAVELQTAVWSSDLLLLGMSSSLEEAEIEVRAGTYAKQKAIMYGFYSDMPYAFYRARAGAWFSPIATDARFIIGLLPETKKGVRDIRSLFPRAVSLNTGNPQREEMSFPRCTRQEVRDRIGVGDEETLILSPGGKFVAGNCAMWLLIMEALVHADISNPVLVLSPHPGDSTLAVADERTRKELSIYAEICRYSPVRTLYVTQEQMECSDVVLGADLVIDFVTSIGIAACYLSIPTISVVLSTSLNKYKEEGGLEAIEAVEVGASILNRGDLTALASCIRELCTPDSLRREELILRQARAYPPPKERGVALKAIVKFLTSLL